MYCSFCSAVNPIASAPNPHYPRAVEVTLSSDQKAFASAAIAEGRLRSEAEVVAEALAIWEDRQRQRIAFLATLTDARASLARGEGSDLTEESLQQLTSSVKERGRTRLAAQLARTA